MNDHKRLFCNVIYLVIATMLFVWGGCANNASLANKHSDSNTTTKIYSSKISAKADTHSVVVHDSVLQWLENSSDIEIRFYYDGLKLNISGTTEGAVVRLDAIPNSGLYGILCYNHGEYDKLSLDHLEIEIDLKMWQKILRRLFNSGVREWQIGKRLMYIRIIDCDTWEFDIFTRDTENVMVYTGACGEYPPNFNMFITLMKEIINEIVRIPLDTKHKEQFGMPISDFEQSIMLMNFEEVTVLRRMSGVIIATDNLDSDDFDDLDTWSPLDPLDWLNLVHALGNDYCDSNKAINSEYSKMGEVKIEHYNKQLSVERKIVPASAEFKKVMDGIRAKIKKDLIIENE